MGYERIIYILKESLKFGGYPFWTLSASAGACFAFYKSNLSREQKRKILLIITLAVCSFIYVIIPAKFFIYHWLPFGYFMILLSSLCFMMFPGSITKIERLIPSTLLITAIIFSFYPAQDFFRLLHGEEANKFYYNRVKSISKFLEENLEGGDKVQSLDWIGGSLHSMLITKTDIATRYLYDFYFYHAVSDEYIKKLRSSFISDIKASMPKLIIKVETNRGHPSGFDTTTEFPELKEFIEKYYIEEFKEEGVLIYRRK